MNRARSYAKDHRIVFILALISCLLALASSTETRATTVCDTDPAAVPFRPTVDPTLLNAVIDTLGAIDVSKTSSASVNLLYRHSLYTTLDSLIDLGGADFIVTPGLGSLEVDLTIPGWNTNLSTSMSHAACRNCDAEYNSCVGGCDSAFNSCMNGCVPGCVNTCDDDWWLPPCFGWRDCCVVECDIICGTPCGASWTACEGICAGAYPICWADVGLCVGEREGIDLLLSGHNFGMSFSSALVTQTADICVSGGCDVLNPLENTGADLSGFTLHLFPTGDALGIGSWLNGIISGLVNWALNIEKIIASFFETPGGDGVLILPFALDIATDGCQPVQEVIDCAAGGCTTVNPQASGIDRSANLLFYALPVAFLLGFMLWRRKR